MLYTLVEKQLVLDRLPITSINFYYPLSIGTFTYFFIELLVFFEHKNDSPCRFQALGANTFLTLFFIFGQTYFIFMYPRLNLHSHKFLNRCVKEIFIFYAIKTRKIELFWY